MVMMLKGMEKSGVGMGSSSPPTCHGLAILPLQLNWQLLGQ
jgi:hypothetical protein